MKYYAVIHVWLRAHARVYFLKSKHESIEIKIFEIFNSNRDFLYKEYCKNAVTKKTTYKRNSLE